MGVGMQKAMQMLGGSGRNDQEPEHGEQRSASGAASGVEKARLQAGEDQPNREARARPKWPAATASPLEAQEVQTPMLPESASPARW